MSRRRFLFHRRHRFLAHCGSVERFGATLDMYPNITRWFHLVGERPAVKRAGAIINDVRIEAAV